MRITGGGNVCVVKHLKKMVMLMQSAYFAVVESAASALCLLVLEATSTSLVTGVLRTVPAATIVVPSNVCPTRVDSFRVSIVIVHTVRACALMSKSFIVMSVMITMFVRPVMILTFVTAVHSTIVIVLTLVVLTVVCVPTVNAYVTIMEH